MTFAASVERRASRPGRDAAGHGPAHRLFAARADEAEATRRSSQVPPVREAGLAVRLRDRRGRATGLRSWSPCRRFRVVPQRRPERRARPRSGSRAPASAGLRPLGVAAASFVTPRNVVYQAASARSSTTSAAPSRSSTGDGRLSIRARRPLVHEAAYHFLLSRIGEHLDASASCACTRSGWPGPGRGRVMLPSGGGKSTLALRALEAEGVRAAVRGQPAARSPRPAPPFPLRIGINATDAARLPPENVRRIERMEFHPKLALDLDAFADRIDRAAPLLPTSSSAAARSAAATLEPLPRRPPSARCCARRSSAWASTRGWSSCSSAGCATCSASSARRRCAHEVLPVAGLRGERRVWRLTIGRDHERNWEALAPLFR